jgi:hypothetical protein
LLNYPSDSPRLARAPEKDVEETWTTPYQECLQMLAMKLTQGKKSVDLLKAKGRNAEKKNRYAPARFLAMHTCISEVNEIVFSYSYAYTAAR